MHVNFCNICLLSGAEQQLIQLSFCFYLCGEPKREQICIKETPQSNVLYVADRKTGQRHSNLRHIGDFAKHIQIPEPLLFRV